MNLRRQFYQINLFEGTVEIPSWPAGALLFSRATGSADLPAKAFQIVLLVHSKRPFRP